MLHLFRFIRKDLIQLNNVKKYILYALGEILLIVVGILIAVKIGEVNQSKRDRFEEQDILQRLREEVEQSLTRYPRFLANVKEKNEALYESFRCLDSAMALFPHFFCGIKVTSADDYREREVRWPSCLSVLDRGCLFLN